MQNINRVTIAGNLTRDPELRATTSGKSVLNFGMAVNDSLFNQQTQEWEDRPNFIDVVVFGNMADSLSKMLHKGMKVCVDGKLRYTSWEKDGQKRSKVEVVAQYIELPPRQQQPQQQYQSQQNYAQTQQQPEYQPQQQQMGNYSNTGQYGAQNGSYDVYDEDIPF